MASYFPLHVCVVLFVSIGSVLSTGTSRVTCSSSKYWMSGKKMTNVTLIKPLWYNETLSGGFVQSNWVNVGGTDSWCWEFYKKGDWSNADGGTPNNPYGFYDRYRENEITKKRKDNKVTIWVKTSGSNMTEKYILEFADVDDAMEFTGEADGIKSSSCV